MQNQNLESILGGRYIKVFYLLRYMDSSKYLVRVQRSNQPITRHLHDPLVPVIGRPRLFITPMSTSPNVPKIFSLQHLFSSLAQTSMLPAAVGSINGPAQNAYRIPSAYGKNRIFRDDLEIRRPVVSSLRTGLL